MQLSLRYSSALCEKYPKEGNNYFLLFPFSQLLSRRPGHCHSLQQQAGMSSSLLSRSGGI